MDLYPDALERGPDAHLTLTGVLRLVRPQPSRSHGYGLGLFFRFRVAEVRSGFVDVEQWPNNYHRPLFYILWGFRYGSMILRFSESEVL